MKLTRIGYNQTVVNLNNGTEIFFSYDTPVAGQSADGIYFRTEEYYSRTTSRHINKYLENVNVVKVSQDVINNLANNLPEDITNVKYTEEEKQITTLEELSLSL